MFLKINTFLDSICNGIYRTVLIIFCRENNKQSDIEKNLNEFILINCKKNSIDDFYDLCDDVI